MQYLVSPVRDTATLPIAEWEVNLAVSGPISVSGRENLNVEKWTSHVRRHDPFWTTVQLSSVPNGVQASVIVKARTTESANDTAVFFFGQMLDVLAFKLNMPLYLSLFAPRYRRVETHVKRIVAKEEWLDAFDQGKEYFINRRTFSRALSWYRKGLTAEDSIDKLIAFWSVLEGIGSKYARDTERTRKGAINQIMDCFDQLWGDKKMWRVIPNNPTIVNQFHEDRSGIAHGYMDLDVDQIREIGERLVTLQQLAYEFLLDWEMKGKALERQAPLPTSNRTVETSSSTES